MVRRPAVEVEGTVRRPAVGVEGMVRRPAAGVEGTVRRPAAEAIVAHPLEAGAIRHREEAGMVLPRAGMVHRREGTAHRKAWGRPRGCLRRRRAAPTSR